MVAAACWLATEVGEGGIFTDQQLRAAIPGKSQVDRRARDLRPFGWVIDTYKHASDLKAHEKRLVRIGTPVWDKAARGAASKPAISAKLRQDLFRRDNHACVRCGAAAGETFADKPSEGVHLTAAHIYPEKLGGKATLADLVTACQRCNEAVQMETANYLTADQVLVRAQNLGRSDRKRLLLRMSSGRREVERLDEIWRAYLQLPAIDRDRVKEELGRLVD